MASRRHAGRATTSTRPSTRRRCETDRSDGAAPDSSPQGPAVRTAMRGEAPSDGRLEDRFAYVPPVPRAYANRSEDVDEAFQAVAELRVLRFRYRDVLDGEEKGARVTAHPYALVLQGGAITCVALDVDRRPTRAFLFDRIGDPEAS